MKAFRTFMFLALAGCVLTSFPSIAGAQSLGERLQVTFSVPVQVPGSVLPAGSYLFESLKTGHMTRILSSDGGRVYGTFLTVPETRGQAPEKASVQLADRASSAPQKVQSWFVAGKNVGNEFVYDEGGK